MVVVEISLKIKYLLESIAVLGMRSTRESENLMFSYFIFYLNPSEILIDFLSFF